MKVWMNMATLVWNDPKELLRRDLTTLRGYARRVVVLGERLTTREEVEVAVHMQELFAIGSLFRLNRAEIVSLLLSALLKAGCGRGDARAAFW